MPPTKVTKRVVYLRDFILTDPPPPYLTWCEGAVRAHLRKEGFDLDEEIRTFWGEERRWEQTL